MRPRYLCLVTSPLGPTAHRTRPHAPLGLTSRAQMNKLIDSGLIPVVETTPSGQRRVDPAAVLDLATWPRCSLTRPVRGARTWPFTLALCRPAPTASPTSGRTTATTSSPAAAGLTPHQAEDAWAGLWNCNPDPYVGSCLIGDVSGFVVAIARITGYRIINQLRRFDLAAPSPEAKARYMRHRMRRTTRPAVPGTLRTRVPAADARPPQMEDPGQLH